MPYTVFLTEEILKNLYEKNPIHDRSKFSLRDVADFYPIINVKEIKF